jgi:hypothetical protein
MVILDVDMEMDWRKDLSPDHGPLLICFYLNRNIRGNQGKPR